MLRSLKLCVLAVIMVESSSSSFLRPTSVSPSESPAPTELTAATTNEEQPLEEIHDLLPKYGFPRGLIPNIVKSYTLSEDGQLQIFLQHPCYVQFDQLVYYDKVVKGKLKYGSVTDVSGIQAKKLFVWVTVTGMDADFESDMVEFHVGVLSQKLPANQFQEIPSCKNKACAEEEESTHPESM